MLVITIMDSSFSVGGTRLSMEEYIVSWQVAGFNSRRLEGAFE
jgi:hypothetical protein